MNDRFLSHRSLSSISLYHPCICLTSYHTTPQAIGTTCLNQYERFDTLLFTMVYPQKPMVKSRTLDLIHFDQVGVRFIALCCLGLSCVTLLYLTLLYFTLPYFTLPYFTLPWFNVAALCTSPFTAILHYSFFVFLIPHSDPGSGRSERFLGRDELFRLRHRRRNRAEQVRVCALHVMHVIWCVLCVVCCMMFDAYLFSACIGLVHVASSY